MGLFLPGGGLGASDGPERFLIIFRGARKGGFQAAFFVAGRYAGKQPAFSAHEIKAQIAVVAFLVHELTAYIPVPGILHLGQTDDLRAFGVVQAEVHLDEAVSGQGMVQHGGEGRSVQRQVFQQDVARFLIVRVFVAPGQADAFAVMLTYSDRKSVV